MTLPRICYVHIGKSAGTWLRNGLRKGYSRAEECDFRFEGDFDIPREQYIEKRFFSAHVGYDFAKTLDAELVTVLRNPFDRITSLYYYWKEVQGAPPVVKELTFAAFLDTRFDSINQDIDNAQAWQLAFGNLLKYRRAHVAVTKDELLARAIDNLRRFAIVGIYENLDGVAAAVKQRYGIEVADSGKRVNKTSSREDIDAVPISIQQAIYARNEIDVALYNHVVREYGRK